MDFRVDLVGKAYLHDMIMVDSPPRYYAVISADVKQMGRFGCGDRGHSLSQMLVELNERQYKELKGLRDRDCSNGIAIGRMNITLGD